MERNCGATTRYVEHINLRPANRKFSSDFVNGTITDGEIFTLERRNNGSIRVYWSGDHELHIEYPVSERTFGRQTSWNDVHIAYGD
jgi:hypothetical protein